jgi:hypothetical protein
MRNARLCCDGLLVLVRPPWKHLSKFCRSVPLRSYTVMESDFLGIINHVHKKDTGCDGGISTNGVSRERSDHLHWTCVCIRCGADFGRLRIGGQNTLSTVLGVLLAGSTYQHYSASCIYSDVLALSVRAFFNAQEDVLRVIDQVFDEHIQRQREGLRGDPKRSIKVRKDLIYFIQHEEELNERMKTDFGLKVRSVAVRSEHLKWLGCRLYFSQHVVGHI